MSKVKIITEIGGEALSLEFSRDLTISEFYDKLELIALFLGYAKQTIDNELNREL